MKSGYINIRPPMGGLHQRYGLQNQEPFTTPDCKNCRPVDEGDGVRRIAMRSGLEQSFANQLGHASGRAIRMLAVMNVASEDDSGSTSVLSDDFGSLNYPSGLFPGESDEWVKMDDDRADATISLAGEYLTTTSSSVSLHPAYVLATDDIDTAERFTLGVTIVPNLTTYSTRAYLYFGLDPDDPTFRSSGIRIEIRLQTYSVNPSLVIRYIEITNSDGDVLASNFSYINASSVTGSASCTALVNGNSIEVRVANTLALSHTLTSAPTGDRVGLGLLANSGPGARIDRFQISYQKTVANTAENPISRIVVASAGGKLYRERNSGVFEQVSMNGTLIDADLMAAEVEGKLYIGDRGDDLATGTCEIATDGVLTPDTATVFDDVIAGWHVCEVVDPNGEHTGTYGISAAVDGSGEITLENWNSASDLLATLTGCTFTVRVGPKVFDPSDDSCVPMVSEQYPATGLQPGWPKGIIPTGNPIVFRYMDCLGFAESRAWQISRQGNPLDWDFVPSDEDDPGRAISGPAETQARVPEPLTAVIAHSDDYLIFASVESLYLLRGHPAVGGRMDTLSRTVGCVGRHAWCEMPDGSTAILARDGVYVVPRGGGSPQDISKRPLPRQLKDLDGQSEIVSMAYDNRNSGVEIWWGRNGFWWDAEDGGFWPQQVPESIKPTRIVRYIGEDPERSGVLFGCVDGRLYAPRRGLATDAGQDIESYCLIGPFRIADDFMRGVVTELDATLSPDSGGVNWEVRAAQSFDMVSRARMDAKASGTWSSSVVDGYGGRNHTSYMRLSGQAFSLNIVGVAGSYWSFVGARAKRIDTGGKLRLP